MPWNWLYFLLLAVFLLIGLLLNLASLPGLWVMVAATCAYAWAAPGFIGVKTLITLVVLALCAEVAEFVAGSAGARRAGGSKRAALGAILGALLGAFLLTFGVPILGTIFGACAGAFLGAVVAEFTTGRGTQQSMKVGVAAAKGRFFGIVAKSMFGVVMALITLWIALPLRSRLPAAPVTAPVPTTTTAPTTSP